METMEPRRDRLTERDEKMSLSEIRRILERGEWWENVRDVSPDEPCPWLDELNGAIEAALDKLTFYEGAEQERRLVIMPFKREDNRNRVRRVRVRDGEVVGNIHDNPDMMGGGAVP